MNDFILELVNQISEIRRNIYDEIKSINQYSKLIWIEHS